MNHETRTHLDLFSGLAGFSLAARANGVRTIQFVEIDPRCRDFLAKAWPGIPVWDDIRTFRWNMGESAKDGRQAGTQLHRSYDRKGPRQRPDSGGLSDPGKSHRGRRASQPQQGSERRIAPRRTGQQVWLLTAGVPCQPASRAGKQRGKDDDRWLWESALEVFAAIRPAWAIFENPPGIEDLFEYGVQLEVDSEGNSTAEVGAVVDRDGRGIFSETLDAIQAQGYAVKTLGIPACGVGAPHRRLRYWIVCRRMDDTNQGGQQERRPQGARGICQWHGQDEPDANAKPVGVSLGDSSIAGHKGPDTEPGADGLCAEYPEGDMANSTERGQREHGAASGQPGHVDQCDQGGMGDTEPECDQRRPMPTGGPEGSFGASDRPVTSEPWSDFVWLPCADGKVRRAPDDSFGLVDGLHRSLLGALGNSITWQVAAEIINAMIQSEESDSVKPRGA